MKLRLIVFVDFFSILAVSLLIQLVLSFDPRPVVAPDHRSATAVEIVVARDNPDLYNGQFFDRIPRLSELLDLAVIYVPPVGRSSFVRVDIVEQETVDGKLVYVTGAESGGRLLFYVRDVVDMAAYLVPFTVTIRNLAPPQILVDRLEVQVGTWNVPPITL